MKFYTRKPRDGTRRVVQAGLNVQKRSEQEGGQLNGLYRAIVLATYATDNEQIRPDNDTRRHAVECDVFLVRSSLPAYRVPVLQRMHGFANASLWIPRPSTTTLDGEEINLNRTSLRGTLSSKLPPALSELDGDEVIIEYVEGDRDYPVITGAMSKENTKRLVIAGPGWSESEAGSERGTPHLDEQYFRFAGVELRINKNGDVLVDTVGAYDHVGDDKLTETPSDAGGQVRVRMKAAQKFTVEMDGTDVLEVWKDNDGVHIDLGENATEHLIKGEKLTTWLLSHFHPDSMGGTLPPIDPAGVVSLTNKDHLSSQHRIK